jgi:gas vesicle protein
MENSNEEHVHEEKHSSNLFVGLLIGALAGAVAMLLYAPQSGKQTRAEIQLKSIQLRDQTKKGIKKAVEDVQSEKNRIATEIREKAIELKELGQDKLVEQLDRVSAALDTEKAAVKAA